MDQPLPSDPMWAAFRRDHPEVTLVLLPDAVPPEAPEAPEAADPSEPSEQSDQSPDASAEDAATVLDTLVRRVGLIAEMLHVSAEPTAGWRSVSEHTVQPQVSLRALATEDTPTDREILAMRLEQLGWAPQIRNESDVVWVDAATDDLLVRVTLFDGIVSIRATGPQLNVGTAVASHLTGGSDD